MVQNRFCTYTARLRAFMLRALQPDTPAVVVAPDFNRLAMELFALQFEFKGPYRKWCDAHSVTPRTAGDWRQIPALPAAAFKEFKVSCLSPAEVTDVFHSSGTTDRAPSRHFHNAESLALYRDSLRLWFNAACPLTPRPLVILTPPAHEAPHSSLVCMFDTIRQDWNRPPEAFVGRAAPDGAWTLDQPAALGALQTAEDRGEPVFIFGTAFLFVHLLDAMTAAGLKVRLPAGSWAMETGGYKDRSRSLTKAKLHTAMCRRLGLAPECILREYGMSELSSQAYDRVPAGPAPQQTEGGRPQFHFPPWARALIISPETGREVEPGQTGLIRVLDLANAYSVLALQTEDLAARGTDGFELQGRAAQAEPRGCSLMTAVEIAPHAR